MADPTYPQTLAPGPTRRWLVMTEAWETFDLPAAHGEVEATAIGQMIAANSILAPDGFVHVQPWPDSQ